MSTFVVYQVATVHLGMTHADERWGRGEEGEGEFVVGVWKEEGWDGMGL
jgi:hypothetical protein